MVTKQYFITSNGVFYSQNELRHHGIKNQKWGVRRFQNKDGSLKPAGVKRYNGTDSTNDSKQPTVGDNLTTAAKTASTATLKINEAKTTVNTVKSLTDIASLKTNSNYIATAAKSAVAITGALTSLGMISTIGTGVIAVGQFVYNKYLDNETKKVQEAQTTQVTPGSEKKDKK